MFETIGFVVGVLGTAAAVIQAYQANRARLVTQQWGTEMLRRHLTLAREMNSAARAVDAASSVEFPGMRRQVVGSFDRVANSLVDNVHEIDRFVETVAGGSGWSELKARVGVTDYLRAVESSREGSPTGSDD